MITFPRLDAMCSGVMPFCREKRTRSDGLDSKDFWRRDLGTTLVILYLWGEVDIGSSVEQQLSYVQVFIVCSNVEGRESSLPGHIGVSSCHAHSIFFVLETRTPNTVVFTGCTQVQSCYLAEYIRIGVVLQEHCGCACVVVARRNVQRREADLSLGAVVDEQGDDILVSLLKSDGEGSESVLQRTGRESGDRFRLAEGGKFRKMRGERLMGTKHNGNTAISKGGI